MKRKCLPICLVVYLLFGFISPVYSLTNHGGWPLAGSSLYTPAMVGELDTSTPGLEIIATSPSGHGSTSVLLVWSQGGSVLWSKDFACNPIPAFPPSALGDLDGDGDNELVFSGCDGNVLVYDSVGNTVRSYILPGNLTTPVLGDVEGDGALEIVVAAKDGNVYVSEENGDLIWSYTAPSSSLISAPSFGEVDGDTSNGLEVVLASSSDVVVLRERVPMAGWPKSVSGGIMFSSPALGDINDDGDVDIIIGTTGGQVYAWKSNGAVLDGWPKSVDSEVEASVILGDINGDSTPEVIAVSANGNLYAWNGLGSNLAGFPKNVGGYVRATPVLADIDGDGQVEIIVGTYPGGQLIAVNADGSTQWTESLGGGSGVASSSPVVSDVDSNNDLEVAAGTNGEGSSYYVLDTGVTKNILKMPWPMARHDFHNTGMLVPVAKITSPSSGLNFTRIDDIQFAGKGLSTYIPINSYDWSSNVDGSMGSNSSFTKKLSQLGAQLITLKVVDNEGREDTMTINLNIVNLPPSVEIASPTSGSVYIEGRTISFEGAVSDPEGDSINSYEWSSNIDGIISSSKSFSTSTLSVGSHAINFTATDAHGGIGRVTITIVVNPKSPNFPPVANITSPLNGSKFYEDEVVLLKGTGTDSDGIVVGYQWVSSIDGLIGNTSDLAADTLSVGYHKMSLLVKDGQDLIGTDTVDILVLPLNIKVGITSPVSGLAFEEGVDIDFNSSITYPFKITPDYRWASSLQGLLSVSSVFMSKLGVGDHNISLLVTDGNRAEGRNSIMVKITPTKPKPTPIETPTGTEVGPSAPQAIASIKKGIEDARKQLENIVYGSDRGKLLPIGIGVALIIGWYIILRKGTIPGHAKKFK